MQDPDANSIDFVWRMKQDFSVLPNMFAILLRKMKQRSIFSGVTGMPPV
jgi:hypothetical protein